MHEQTYYQCDWTGFPMQSSNCYMPSWSTGKLSKHGSYCNWESVLAHARHKYEEEKNMEESELVRIEEYILNATGVKQLPDTASLHFSKLGHFKGNVNWSIQDYLTVAHKAVDPVTAVLVGHDGSVGEITINPEEGVYNFAHVMREAGQGLGPLQSVTCMRKAKSPKDRNIEAFYWPSQCQRSFNTTASNILKMHIYGDVLFVQKTVEHSLVPRDRYVDFFLDEHFNETFSKKRKKGGEALAVTPDEFQSMKAEMQESMDRVEAKISAKTTTPKLLAKAAALPLATGKELVEAARLHGELAVEGLACSVDRVAALERRLVAVA